MNGAFPSVCFITIDQHWELFTNLLLMKSMLQGGVMALRGMACRFK